jgi:hypothetical protein
VAGFAPNGAADDASLYGPTDAASSVVPGSAQGPDAAQSSPLPPFGNETIHPDRISFYMVPDLETPYTSNWPAVQATFAQLHALMPDAWVRWDNETGHDTNDEAQVSQYVASAEAAGVSMIVAASASLNYNNMWANQYVTGNSNAQANASILDIANGGFIGFAQALLTGHANVKLVETLNEPDGPGWFVTDPDDAADFDVYMTNVYASMGVVAGNAPSAANLVGPAVAFEGQGNIWNDWLARSELTNVSYHTYAEPARAGLHDVPGKNVYVTEYGYQTTPISPAALLDDLWNIEKDGSFCGTIRKVFYNQLMQNGTNPAAFSQTLESGQAHFAERGWFRALAAWVALGNIGTSAARDDANPDYLATDDRNGNAGVLLWNYTGATETGQTRTVANTSVPTGTAFNVLHILYGNNTDAHTGDCEPASQQTVVSVTTNEHSVTVVVNALGLDEAVYVTTRECDALAE